MLTPIASDLARCLLDYEATAGDTSVPSTLRVYEKLRHYLSALAGTAGFQSLASRSLTLARAEAPSLAAVQVAADGSLQGLEPLFENDQPEEAGGILIAQLLGLLRAFIGESLTLSLLQDVWPEAAFEQYFNSGERRKE